MECQFKSSCFEKLSIEELEYVDQNRVEVDFKKGENICKQGSIASHILYLKKGLAKIYFENKEKSLIFRVIPSGNLFALPSLNDNRFHYSAACFEPSTVCMIDIKVFRKFIATNAKFSAEIINILNENTLVSYERIFCLTQNQLAGRMANILLCLKKRIYKSDEFDLIVSRKDLAELTNMSVESVTRILKDFKTDKIIDIQGKKFKLLDIPKLKSLCDFG